MNCPIIRDKVENFKLFTIFILILLSIIIFGCQPIQDCTTLGCAQGYECDLASGECIHAGGSGIFQTGVWVEAEAGTLVSPMQKSNDGSYIFTPTGNSSDYAGKASYTFNVQEAGEYIIEARVLATEGESNSFFVGLKEENAQGDSGKIWLVQTSSDWTNDQVNWVNIQDPKKWDLTIGKKTFVFWGRGSNTKLDKIKLTKIGGGPSSCTDAYECGASSYCIAGQCSDSCPTGSSCNAYFGYNQKADDGICENDRCLGVEGTICDVSGECRDGYGCGSDGVCIPDTDDCGGNCGKNSVCVNGQCKVKTEVNPKATCAPVTCVPDAGCRYVNPGRDEDGCETCGTQTCGSIVPKDYISTKYSSSEKGAFSLVEVTDELGVVTESKFDRLGNLVKVTEARGTANSATSVYGYDSLNRLVNKTDPKGNVAETKYNTLGQVVSTKHPDIGETQFLEYDLNGNILKSKDANGRITQYTYDKLNRPKSITWVGYPRAGQNRNLVEYYYGDLDYSNCGSFKANAKGKICKIKDYLGEGPNGAEFGLIEFKYDDTGRTVQEKRTIPVNGANKIFNTYYEYDRAGRLTKMTYPSGKQLIYTYNKLSQLVKIDLKADGKTENIVNNYNYNPQGLTLDKTYGNKIKTEYEYDLRNRMTQIDSDVVNRKYEYDVVGNLKNSYKDNRLFGKYTYDDLYRLKTVVSSVTGNEEFQYDQAGNRRTKITDNGTTGYVYFAKSNRLNSISGALNNLIYDKVGNMLDNGFGSNYEYDFNNRLTKATFSGGKTEQYFYDYLGNRIKKIDSDGKTHVYLYDLSSTLIEEIKYDQEISGKN